MSSAPERVFTCNLPSLGGSEKSISNGVDRLGHTHRDPLAEINLVEDDFDWATGQLMERAARYSGNRVVSLLEGGYDLQGLAFSVAAHVARLMKG